MRKSLTDKGVAALKPRAQRYAFPDPELRGHYVRVQPSGAKSFVTVARSPSGKQLWTTLGAVGVVTIDEARDKARNAIKRVRAGLPAIEFRVTQESFQVVAERWLSRHVTANGLRSQYEIERLLRVHVFPAWRDRLFLTIRRSDVADLLDHVEDHHSARQADYVLNVVRSVMNWFATRNDDYTPPIVRGMKRQKTQARARILNDDEIRAIWRQAEVAGTFGGIVRMCLLTAQRRTKVSQMCHGDIAGGEWTISTHDREKETAGTLPLPTAALDIIAEQPRLASNNHVFTGRGAGPFRGFSKAKNTFGTALPAGFPVWVLHDLRRTARSLLSRAGVRPDIAERVMGHAIRGVEGVYDRHEYRDEKADALRRLAALIGTIVTPNSDNVRPLRGKAAAR